MTYTIHGRYESNFEPLADVFLQQLPKSPRVGGQALTVYHRGVPVVDIWSGVRDKAGTPWRADTMSISYSTTKGVLSTLAHMLVDEGVLAYDTPIARWWPEFAANGKHGITLRHVMTHESGLYHIRQMIENAREMLDWPHMLEVIAAAKPYHAPGERVGYHALTYGWIVGGLIEKATGRPLAELLDEKLVQPLQLDGCYIGVPDSELPRCAEIIGAARHNPNPKPPSKVSVWRQKLISNALALTGFDDNTSTDALLPRGMSRFYLGRAGKPASLHSRRQRRLHRTLAGAHLRRAGQRRRTGRRAADVGAASGGSHPRAQPPARRRGADADALAHGLSSDFHHLAENPACLRPLRLWRFRRMGRPVARPGGGLYGEYRQRLAHGDLRIMRINTAVIQCVES